MHIIMKNNRVIFCQATLNLLLASIFLFCSNNSVNDPSSIHKVTNKVTYDANGAEGGNVPEDKKSYKKDDEVVVLGNTGTLTKMGYVFDGWNTETDGTGTRHTPGTTFLIGSVDVVLYAHWEVDDPDSIHEVTSTVAYDANGAEEGNVPEDEKSYKKDGEVVVLGNTGTLTKEGYVFDGWNTEADGTGTRRYPGTKFSMGSVDVVLYAQWKVNSSIMTFEKTFGGTGYDAGRSVLQTNDSGYIIVGYTAPSTAGSHSDVYLIKTDVNGNESWSKTFGGADNDDGYAVQQTSDSGFIITGDTKSYGAGGLDIYLVKTDAHGNENWSNAFGGTVDDYSFSVQQTSDGGFIIAGFTYSFGFYGMDAYLIRTGSGGNETWSKTFGGKEIDGFETVQQTNDGGFIMVGSTRSFGSEYYSDVYLVKTDENGNETWSRTFGGTYDDNCASIQSIINGGFIMVGSTKSFGAGEGDVYLIKTDDNGDEIWSKTFGGAELDAGYSVQQTTDGGFIISGWTKSFGSGKYTDVYLIKTDENGNETWSRTFGGTDNDFAYSVQQTNDGGYIIAGFTNKSPTGRYADIYLIKTDENGDVSEE